MFRNSHLQWIGMWIAILALLTLAGSGRVSLNAQVPTGGISCMVTLGEGQPVPGVLATLTSSGLALTQISNPSGLLHFQSLPLGEYELILQFEGFKTVRYSVAVSTGRTLSISAIMSPIGSPTDPELPLDTSNASLWNTYH
jgi:hypothetical protein